MSLSSIVDPDPLSFHASLGTTENAISHCPSSSPSSTPVLLLTLNRPKHHNAFTNAIGGELVQVYSRFDIDERVKCIVMTGAGEISCAGADLDVGFEARRASIKEEGHRDGCICWC